ncbi:unnamed protein product [Symbiodinium sp. CCMP2592]|nr:unnamed protein product [Symbiodinium sp. CCMP2592]
MDLPMAALWAFMVVLFRMSDVVLSSSSECQPSDSHSAALLQRETNQRARAESSEEQGADEELEVMEHDRRSVSGWARGEQELSSLAAARRRRSDATFTYTTTTTTTPWWAKDVDDRLEVMKTELSEVAKHVQRLEGQENSTALLQHVTDHDMQGGSITEALDEEEADEEADEEDKLRWARRRRRSQRTRPLIIDTDPTPPYVGPLDDRLDMIEIELEEVEQRIQQLEGEENSTAVAAA